MFKILPFKSDSTGAKILADNLPAELLNHDGTRVGRNDVVINWGCGWSRRYRVDVNQPEAICNAVQKLRAFDLFRDNDIPHPSHTRSKSVAKRWLTDGNNVYARTTMEGERGRGIEVIHPNTAGRQRIEEVDVPVYVKGFQATREFRIHVAFGQVIEVNEKKRRNGTNPDPLVRSSSDWVFCVYNLAPYPALLGETAIEAVNALGLDFGGVDIALDSSGNVCVYEVNTAPWINRESSTLAYVNAFKEKFHACASG